MPVITTYPNLSSLNLTNNTLITIVQYGNTITGGWLSPLFLAVIFLVVFITTADWPIREHALTASSFITCLFALGMMGSGILSPIWFFGCMLLFFASAYMSSKYVSG